uniref:Uncharacterized protein n=1 Tax=viral metagenome TaxID=1070528 RepID=A0A6M3KUB2_9ZZZZ
MPLIEPFALTQEDSDVTQADTSAGVMGDLFSYRVAKGKSILLRPSDVLALDLDNTSAAVAANTCKVKLEKRDITGQEKTPLLGPLQYASFAASGVGEFQDEDKLVHLEIGKEIEVGEQEYIVLMGDNPTTGLDKDTSFMELRTHSKR